MNYFPNGQNGENFCLTKLPKKKKRVQMIGQQGLPLDRAVLGSSD